LHIGHERSFIFERLRITPVISARTPAILRQTTH
jgi:hypothetical protein